MAGYIDIDFGSVTQSGQTLNVVLEYLNSSAGFNERVLNVEFVPYRNRTGTASVGETARLSAINYARAVALDYRSDGGSNNISAQALSGTSTVRISVASDTWRVKTAQSFNSYIPASYSVSNEELAVPKNAFFDGYDLATSDCSGVTAKFNVSGGNNIFRAYVNGELYQDGSTSEFSSPVLIKGLERGSFYNISFNDTAGLFKSSRISFRVPRKLISDDVKIGLLNDPTGAIVTISVEFVSSYLSPFEYSLDGVNFQESNVFSGQPVGDYTIYVQDAFGCVVSKNFVVDGASTVTEVIMKEPSLANPMRWSKVETGERNRYNTLSHEQVKNVAYSYEHLFTEDDTPVNQFKTNAPYISVFALECDGTKTELNEIKRSDHIGQSFKTSATKYSYEGKLALRFGAVDIYDVLTDQVVDSKDFGFDIPFAFREVGRVINISSEGNMPVSDILYDENFEAFVLLFEAVYTGNENPVTAQALYNIQNYEIYEFITPMLLMPTTFNLVIEVGLSENEITHSYMSERVRKVVDSDRLTAITYWNTSNFGKMNYGTGIMNTVYVESVLDRPAPLHTLEGYNGSRERINTSQEIYDRTEYFFLNLPEEIARQVDLILGHDKVLINGVPGLLGEDPEFTPSYTHNFMNLTAIMSRNGDITEADLGAEVVVGETGLGLSEAEAEIENAIAAIKGKALILYKNN